MQVRFDDFSGGLWIPGEAGAATEQAGFAIPENGLLQADNVDFLPEGALRGRRGSVKASSNTRPGPILALARYYGRQEATLQVSGFGLLYSDPTLPGAAWINPQGAGALDFAVGGSYAQVNLLGGTQSEYLTRVSCFGASPLPANATITGLRVRVWVRPATATGTFSDGDLPDGGCRVIQGGTFVGNGKQATFITIADREAFTPGADYPFQPSAAVLEYGGEGDTWGLAGTQLTPAAFNDPGFGVGYRVKCAAAANALVVDYIEVTAYFSATTMSAFLVAHDAGASVTWQKLAGGAYSPITGGTYADPSRRPVVVAWPQKGALFLFDGINPVKRFNGVDIADVATLEVADGGAGIAPKKGPFACLHRNRLWASDPGESQFSVYGSDINDERNWRPSVQLSCNDSRGGKITGLASFQETLVILKDTALFAFDGDPDVGGTLVEYDSNGCIAPDTVQVTPFGVIYLARDGLRITDGRGSQLLSRPVRPLFRSRSSDTTYTDAVGVYFQRREQYWIKLDPAAAEGYILHRVTFPTTDGDADKLCWSRNPALPMNCGTCWPGSEDAGELYIGDVAGEVWQRDTGTSDNGVAFLSIIRTQERLLDRDRRMGRVIQLRPLFRGEFAIIMGIRYDQAASEQIGLLAAGEALAAAEYQEPRVWISDMANFGRYLSLTVVANGAAAFELHRIDADVRLRGARVWR